MTTKPIMRMYQEIWEKLKAEYRCTISAPPEYHARIKRMVSKEKDTDAGFKLEMLEESGSTRVAKLSSSTSPKNRNLLTFVLTIERV